MTEFEQGTAASISRSWTFEPSLDRTAPCADGVMLPALHAHVKKSHVGQISVEVVCVGIRKDGKPGKATRNAYVWGFDRKTWPDWLTELIDAMPTPRCVLDGSDPS